MALITQAQVGAVVDPAVVVPVAVVPVAAGTNVLMACPVPPGFSVWIESKRLPE